MAAFWLVLPPLDDGKHFDLFLSHAQDFGQDQGAITKAALVKLLPSIEVFLGVESLGDLHDLETLMIMLSPRAVLFSLPQAHCSIATFCPARSLCDGQE
jgi:hypothetical protein